MKLKYIQEKRITEKLESIANGTYATDSAQEIANWIVNKPKPYRIIYDKVFDVWCIADANLQTHSDMALDLFDSNYLYSTKIDPKQYVQDVRDEINDGTYYTSGWTDAEVYQDYQFTFMRMKGLIFIPYGMKYADYEESGFYSIKKKISTGIIFTQRPGEFSSNGIFSSLFNKLAIMGELTPRGDGE